MIARVVLGWRNVRGRAALPLVAAVGIGTAACPPADDPPSDDNPPQTGSDEEPFDFHGEAGSEFESYHAPSGILPDAPDIPSEVGVWIYNGTGSTLHDLYVTRCDDPSWGEDLLDDETIDDGAYYWLEPVENGGCYDIYANDWWWYSYVGYGYTASEGAVWGVYESY